MNLSRNKDIIPEKTEDLLLMKKDLSKVFQICKIKKYSTIKCKFSKFINSEDSKIFDKNKIIMNEISLCYIKNKKNPNNSMKFIDKSFKCDNTSFGQNKNNIFDKAVKIYKKTKSGEKIYNRKTKNKKRNQLIRPILVEDEPQENIPLKNIEKPTNLVNINIKNNFSVNSIFNNFIFDDIKKVNPINNNIFSPFTNYNQKNVFNEKFNFNFKPFPLNEDFFKSNVVQFPFSSNNNKIINYPFINTDKLKKKDKFNVSIATSPSQETILEKNKFILIEGKKKKGRKSKILKNMNIASKHTKFSSDNMMRKIKNKIIESSRLLINKILSEEIQTMKGKFQFPYIEFKKIKGSFGQELNIKFNLWFYQIKIKDIFSMEISNKYSSLEKTSNKELIDYIFSQGNINYFEKSKELLNMPFHQYYHDIFLGENKNWINNYNIKPEENKYEINYLLKCLEEENKDDSSNKIYLEKINRLAHEYEDFFLYKKMRNVDLGDKRNDFIKSFMNNTLKSDFTKYFEQVESIKNSYKQRNNILNQKFPDLSKNVNINNIQKADEQKNENKSDDILKNIIISINDDKNIFLERKRKPDN